MRLMRTGLLLAILAAFSAAVGWKLWHGRSAAGAASTTRAGGPEVLLFKGDNDPDCRAVYRLVDQAATHEDNGIRFVRVHWSSHNPLIKEYRIRFLPTVVFVDRSGRVVARIVGENPKVRERLAHALARAPALLRP